MNPQTIQGPGTRVSTRQITLPLYHRSGADAPQILEVNSKQEHRIRLGVTCALFVLIFGAAADLKAAPHLEYEATLSLPAGCGRSALPVSVSAGMCHEQEVCVTDATGASGLLFDAKNTLVFGSGVIAGLSAPMDMTVDVTGGFACTDAKAGGGRTIKRLNFFGEPLFFEPEKPQEDWEPEHLLVTRDGSYVTTDPSAGLLTKHASDTGALVWSRSLAKTAEGELLGLGRPAEAADGRLYIPCGGNRVVMVLSAEGEYETSFGVAGTGRGRFSFPVGVAVCPDGTIAVLDRMRAVVLLFDAAYGFVEEYGQYGGGPKQLYQPVAIASMPDGRIYVAQGFQARIHQFRFSTTTAAAITSNGSRSIQTGGTRVVDLLGDGDGCL
jgi:hypothetical protein